MTDPVPSGKAPVWRIVEVLKWIATEEGYTYTTLDNNYTSSIIDISKNLYNISDDDDRDGNSAARGWMWLSCGMALGWLQTTDNSNSMFNRMVPLELV